MPRSFASSPHLTDAERRAAASLLAARASRASERLVSGPVLLTILLALLVAVLLWSVSSASAQTRTIIDHPNRVALNVADLGATLTEIGAAISGQAYYVYGIVLTSSTATGGTFAIRAGSGVNCASSVVGVWPQPGVVSPTLTYPYPANTVQPYVITFPVPIKAPVGSAICLIGTATNLARGAVLGFTAP